MTTNTKPSKEELTRKKVVQVLSEFLGVDYQEISDDDSFAEDLHMTTSDFAEFIAQLENMDIDTNDLDLHEAETVGSLIELIHLNQPL
jgi:acyl carrier protein